MIAADCLACKWRRTVPSETAAALHALLSLVRDHVIMIHQNPDTKNVSIVLHIQGEGTPKA